MTLYILAYNNYYNRILKREETVSDYQPYILHTLQNTNFNPADGINTQHVFGSNANAYDGKGDYLIAVEDGVIKSRWFILEANRSRAGQWTLDLYRDLIADYYDTVMTAPAFIEKATISDITDPAIFNKEDISFNQIKTSETYITDKTKCKWLVGYLAKDFSLENDTLLNTAEETPDIIGDEGSEIYSYTEDSGNYILLDPSNSKFRIIMNSYEYNSYYEYMIDTTTGSVLSASLDSPRSIYSIIDASFGIPVYVRKYFPSLYLQNKGTLPEVIAGLYSTINTVSNQSVIDRWNGKYFYNSTTGKYYNVVLVDKGVQTITKDLAANAYGWEQYVNLATAWIQQHEGTITSINEECPYASTSTDYHAYQFRLVDVSAQFAAASLKFSLPATRMKTTDAVYDIFAIPYPDEPTIGTYYEAGLPKTFSISKETGMLVAQAIAQRYGVGASPSKLYDLQILPFCPINAIETYHTSLRGFYITQAVEPFISYITTNDETAAKQSFIAFAQSSQVHYDINLSESLNIPQTALDYKLSNECDVYRLCSGDYSSAFEFSPAKMNGRLQFFDIDMTAKPYTPYIRVAPYFQGLYGKDFMDARGLICGGDFSLSTVTDPFNTYKLQNKNFQLAFDRQIENLEVQQKVARTQDIVGAISGTFTGAAGGAIAGSTGGAAGAIAGAVVGAGASLAGGIADVALNDKLRNEAIDYAQDQFGYQMGNIKALPYTLNKVDAFTQNNKVFPVLEYYTCTPVERAALLDKLTYNGWTIMRIGKIENFIQPEQTYIKAKLIRLEDLGEDYHVLNQISAELNKGIFI